MGDKPKDNWQSEDAITSIMAQTQNVQNMLVRAAHKGHMSSDTKAQAKSLLKSCTAQLDRIRGFHDD